ncbi:MAG: hypothetical protein ACD_23C00433G0001 [uncultured bacterium]|nr:MAG: hypothetical protein ACD_23C00433G0001 [uncultured bacterium]
MDRELYQRQYDFELEQRNSIASSTNTPVVSITIIGGALSSMILAFPYTKEIITFGFILCALLSAISSIVALVYIFKSIIGYSYQKIPSFAALVEYFEKLKNWHRKNGADAEQITQESKKDFYAYFEARLSEAADHNGNNNLRRGNYIHDSTVAIGFALAFMGMCSLFFIYAKSNGVENTHRVEVVNPITLTSEVRNMADNENSGNSGNSESQSAVPAQQPAAPAQTTQSKPSGPPNVVFKGSVDTTKKTMSTTNETLFNSSKGSD